jgi:hypothetical protein
MIYYKDEFEAFMKLQEQNHLNEDSEITKMNWDSSFAQSFDNTTETDVDS